MKSLLTKEYKILMLNSDVNSLKVIERVLLNLYIKIKIIYASTTSEATSILKNNGDIALALLNNPQDLEIIHYIRKELFNTKMRIIIFDLEKISISVDTINRYDINHICYMTEQLDKDIFTTIRTALIQYEQLSQLEYKQVDTYKKMITDPLTHLYNRRKLNEDCIIGEDKTLILIDIIGFSNINENYGYEVGDSVLKEFSAFLNTMYSDEHNVYHLEKDLFALMPNINSSGNIFAMVKSIRNDILNLNIITNNFNKALDISIGVAYQNEKNILRKAELALKEARNKGINKIQYYSQDLKILRQINHTSFWMPIIQEAINSDSILVYYQPVYNLRTYNIDKYELLMRIKYEGKVYMPGSFLDAAYHARQMYDIFKFMFITACKQAQKTGLKFSVNIGNQELETEGLIEFIQSTLAKYKTDVNSISVEILEYNSVSNNRQIKENILAIHALGIQIIIDDFGVNCSNFGQLQDLPISVIKIDGSFIKNIDKSKESQIIVKTIQTYAKEKNIKLVAEYITNKQVLATILRLNIEYGQGNYLCMAQEKISMV